jgi:hypothetical protein
MKKLRSRVDFHKTKGPNAKVPHVFFQTLDRDRMACTSTDFWMVYLVTDA